MGNLFRARVDNLEALKEMLQKMWESRNTNWLQLEKGKEEEINTTHSPTAMQTHTHTHTCTLTKHKLAPSPTPTPTYTASQLHIHLKRSNQPKNK